LIPETYELGTRIHATLLKVFLLGHLISLAFKVSRTRWLVRKRDGLEMWASETPEDPCDHLNMPSVVIKQTHKAGPTIHVGGRNPTSRHYIGWFSSKTGREEKQIWASRGKQTQIEPGQPINK